VLEMALAQHAKSRVSRGAFHRAAILPKVWQISQRDNDFHGAEVSDIHLEYVATLTVIES
jgi:hypothetical protein